MATVCNGELFCIDFFLDFNENKKFTIKTMSFRSRSRTAQPPLPSRRRSLSSSRAGSVPSSSLYGSSYNGGNSIGGYSPSSTSSATSRPLSTGYYQNNSVGSSSSYYQSPYANTYSSRDNLYSSNSNRNGYYSNGNNPNTSRRDYSSTTSNPNKFHSSYMNNYLNNSSSAAAYGSSSGGGGGSGGGGASNSSYESRYPSNPYNSDRYMSPYTSYDNGVTTASLSFGMGSGGGSKGSSGGTATSSSSFKGSNSYLNKMKTNDYPARSTNSAAALLKTKSLSTSNGSLSSLSSSYPVTSPAAAAQATSAAIVARSNSLREQERKGRNRTRSRSAAQRSMSASSEKSEGYESGTERTSRSRLGSSASTAAATDDSKTRDKTENGDFIDYKALWEAVKLENEKLKQQLKKKDDEIVSARATVERFTNATTKNTLSEIEKRERRAMERKLSEMEEELKQLQKLKTENDRLRAENRALTRVVSKLTTSAQNQLQNKKN